MSSLHESVSRRRAEESADLGCVSLQPGGSALVIRQWRGATWVLPWSHFASARLTGGDGDSQLELAFTHCFVTVAGAHLGGLVEELVAGRVSSLRDLPEAYRPPAGEAALFVSQIEVRAR